jgi:aryl-alcohol dehydrogenase-like predicted oxidoreductase
MEKKQLGKSGILISELGLGTMSLSLSTRPPEEQAIETIHRALDLGITYFDTADSYSRDESDTHHGERLLRKALQQYEGDTSQVMISTKGGIARNQGEWILDGNPDRLRKTIRESFQALGGEKPIDLWFYHRPDPNYPIEQSLAPVQEAVEEGLIRFVGLSNFLVKQIQRARNIVEVVAVQSQLNPWHRNPEFDGVLAFCEREGLTLIASSPFGGIKGARRLSPLETLSVFAELAQEKGISIYSLMLAWERAKSPVIIPLVGASKPASIENSVESLALKLSLEEIQRLDRSVPFGFGRVGLGWLKFQFKRLSGTLKP